MSRSVHTTRRQLYELEQANYASRTEWQGRVGHARRMLAHKRAVKEQVRRRRARCPLPDVLVDAASISIEVRDQGTWVHYPASAEDVRSILQLLPPGTVDGLSRIVLCLDTEYQRSLMEGKAWDAELGPLRRRYGYESLPNVYRGEALGSYIAHDTSIWLYAYVYQADAMPDREVRELYLRLQMLVSLLHEVAHHSQGTLCDRRGRWIDWPSEWSVRKRAYRWTQQVVIPYLEQHYPVATQALVEWVSQHGGCALQLISLVNHPDESLLYTTSAVQELWRSYDRGLSPRETRLTFARNLHFADRYDEALQAVATLLAEYPQDSAVLTLQADIYEHQERYEQAERVARAVVAAEPTYADAWLVLVDVYRAQGRWPELEQAATRALELERQTPVRALTQRTCARIELGESAGAEADLRELRRISRVPRARSGAVVSLGALLLLRTERYEEALQLAQSSLARPYGFLCSLYSWCGVLPAVRYEAAHHLGRPYEAGTLAPSVVNNLRRHGHGSWLDRLVADYGLRIRTKHRA